MSLSVQTDVFCDIEGDNCVFWTHGGPSSNVAQSRQAREYARRDGWVRQYNKEENRWEDICPNCSRERIERLKARKLGDE